MVFDTVATEHAGGQRTLAELAGNCSMVDPAISGEGGWVSATRMVGTGGVLLVVPEEGLGVQARCRGDVGEMWGRCRGDVGEM